MALDRIYLPSSMTWRGLCWCFLVPGYGFYLRGPRVLGKGMMGACALLFLFFIIWFGHALANLAFGLILSIHVSGITYYCDSFLRQWELPRRILFTVLVLFAVGFGFYSPLRNMIQKHWLMPLQVNGQVVVVEKNASAGSVRRGDWVAYQLGEYSRWSRDDLTINTHSSVGFGPVLAVGGDQVIFSNNVFVVNGIAHPLLPYMPSSGGVMVPENYWFIWPSYSITGHGYEGRITETMMSLASVPEQNFVGKPLNHWFWQKQTWQ